MTEALANPPAREEELWRQWLHERSASVRIAIFFFYAEWVRIVASSMVSRYPHPLAEWQDYVQLASQGLLKAIDRFDPTIQSNFKAYAEPYLKGDILRGLSCFVRDRQNKIAPSSDQQELLDEGDFYGLEEIVDVAVGLAFGHFLELGITDPSTAPGDPLDAYEAGRESLTIRRYVGLLPPRERQLIEAHYFQHLPFSDIADLLKISRPRVTQLHQQALSRIRSWYEEDSDLQDIYL